VAPGFDVFVSLSMPERWFACTRLLDPHLTCLMDKPFPSMLTTTVFTNAARGGLKPAPAGRLRRDKPPSHVQLLILRIHYFMHAGGLLRHTQNAEPVAGPGYGTWLRQNPHPPPAQVSVDVRFNGDLICLKGSV